MIQEKMKLLLLCVKCKSSDTYHRKKDDKRVCRKCGLNSKIKIIEKSKSSECKFCGSLCTYVRMDNTQICNKCGKVEQK